MSKERIKSFRRKIKEKKYALQINKQNSEEYLNELPENFEWEENVLKYSGKEICKFLPIPIKKFQDLKSGKNVIVLKIYKKNTFYIKEVEAQGLKSLKTFFKEEIFFPNARNIDNILEYLITTLL